MKKLLNYLFIGILFVVFITLSLLFLVQTDWAKEKINRIVQELALQHGSKLKIEKIEGELPLNWKLKNVYLDIDIHQTVEIDELYVRFSFWSLLKKQLGISHLSANKVLYIFTNSENKTIVPLPAFEKTFFVRSFICKHLTIRNFSTGLEETYSITGGCHFKSYNDFKFTTNIQSEHLYLNCGIQKQFLSKNISSFIDINLKSKQGLYPFVDFPETAFSLQWKGKGPLETYQHLLSGNRQKSFALPLEGTIGLRIYHLKLPQLSTWNGELITQAEFAVYPNRKMEIKSLNLESDLMQLKGKASFDSDFYPESINGVFSLPHFSYFSPMIEGQVSGSILYDPRVCQVEAEIPQLYVKNTIIEDLRIAIDAAKQEHSWLGTLAFSSLHPELGFTSQSSFSFDLNEVLKLDHIAIQSKSGSLVGDLTFNIRDGSYLQGGCLFEVEELSPFSCLSAVPLEGQLSGKIDLKNTDISCQLLAKNLRVQDFKAGTLNLDLFITDIFEKAKGRLYTEIQRGSIADLSLDFLYYSMDWDFVNWNYQLQAIGEWKNHFEMDTEGCLTFSPKNLHLQCHRLQGVVLNKSILLEKPFDFSIDSKEMLLSDVQIKVGDGSIYSFFHLKPQNSSFIFRAEHFPLDFASLLSQRFSLNGLSSINIELQVNHNQLKGSMNALLEHADVFPAGMDKPIQTKGCLQLNIDKDVVQFHSYFVATDQQFLEMSASVPIIYNQSAFKISLDPNRNIAAQCTVEGHIEQLLDFINLGAQRLGGFISARLLLNGTLDNLFLWGPLTIEKGFYQNYMIGMALEKLDIKAEAVGRKLIANHMVSQDEGDGVLKASATIEVNKHLPFFLEGEVENFLAIQFDWLVAPVNGKFKFFGDLNEGKIEGDFDVVSAQIKIPEKLPVNPPSLPVRFLSHPEYCSRQPKETPKYFPLYYDISIKARKNIRLFGYGLDARLQGDLQFKGQNLDLIIIGTLNVDQGKFTFANKEFFISQGEMVFSEKEKFINITCSAELTNMTVNVLLRGSPTAPELTLQSMPPRPVSEILASILFNKEISELNAAQAILLANTAVTLSGPNIIDTLRKNLGIDRLSISTSEDTGQISVHISKELLKGVMVTLSQSAESSQIIVEVQLKKGFVLQAETQENNQGKFSVKWNKNY